MSIQVVLNNPEFSISRVETLMHIFNSECPFAEESIQKYTIPAMDKYIELRGYLYLVQSSAFPEVVKIGRTSNFTKRLQAYNTDQPFDTFTPIAVSKLLPDVIIAEKKILQHLQSKLITPLTLKHEWFKQEHTELLMELICKAEEYYLG